MSTRSCAIRTYEHALVTVVNGYCIRLLVAVITVAVIRAAQRWGPAGIPYIATIYALERRCNNELSYHSCTVTKVTGTSTVLLARNTCLERFLALKILCFLASNSAN